MRGELREKLAGLVFQHFGEMPDRVLHENERMTAANHMNRDMGSYERLPLASKEYYLQAANKILALIGEEIKKW